MFGVDAREAELLAALLVSALTLAVIASTGIGAAAGAQSGTSASEAFEAVDQMIGTGFNTTENKGNSAYGNTWPGAAMPFGMTQFTPTTHGTRRNPDSGGYEYAANELRGPVVHHTHAVLRDFAFSVASRWSTSVPGFRSEIRIVATV